jgi:trigger factor
MQTSLETLGELERRLTMSVPVAEIESEIQQRLARLAKNVKVPGFRPGKVPLKMVAQQYGTQVRSDVISDAVKANFADAIREQNLRIAGNPRIEPRTGAGAADALEFSAVFEIYPEVKVGDMSDVTIERPTAEVALEDIERTLKCCGASARATSRPTARHRQAIGSPSISPARPTAPSSPAGARAISPSWWARDACCPSSKRR